MSTHGEMHQPQPGCGSPVSRRHDYTISENTRHMTEHGIARASEILELAGAKNIAFSRTVLNSPGHLLGTARMGLDPERSVVNERDATTT
jgi:choline dehydrogenase-like flavoprotein